MHRTKMRYRGEDEALPKMSLGFVKRILAYFRPYKLRLLGVILLLLATSLLGLVPAMLLQQIVDVALPGQNLTQLAALVGLSVAATIVLNLLRVGQGFLSTWIAKKIIYTMKNQMYSHLSGMPLAFFAGVKPGDITTRMNSDIDGLQEVFQTTVVNAINSVFVLATTLLALFTMNWKLALVGIATIPLFILPTRKVGRIRWKITAQSQEKLSDLNQRVQETLSGSGSTLMKLCATEEAECQRFEDVNGEVTQLQVKETLAGRWFRMAMDVFTTIGPMLVYLVGGFLLVRGEMSIGGILTFASLLTRLYNPVTQISNIHIDFMRSFALFDRIFAYLDMDQQIVNDEDARPVEFQKGEVAFANVSFAYQDIPALENVSFTAQPGESIAIVGPSGAGKSTLTNLIPRLYDVQQGGISVDGVDIRKIDLGSLRMQIGMVTQEPYLFNGSLRENLLYGNEDATEEEVIRACRAAYIHDFIASLPEGYDSQVGNRGIKLSGGEKQRIAIARVILKDPKILILDEATSALDAISEHYVQKAMDELLKNRTSFVIAHRLSTIQNADRILVLDKGKIVESGCHRDLLEEGGLYAALYNTQFAHEEAA